MLEGVLRGNQVLGSSVSHCLLTWKPSRADSSWALPCCKMFPAFVTNTTGTRSCPSGFSSLWKASCAAGMILWPRTSTPSMSNRNPKVGGLCTEGRQEGPLSRGMEGTSPLTLGQQGFDQGEDTGLPTGQIHLQQRIRPFQVFSSI